MRIVFHGGNAANFRHGFESLLQDKHEILDLSDELVRPGEAHHFEQADVIVGVRLAASHPKPLAVRLYQAPAAGTDAIDVGRLPPGAALCNAFGHENAIAEYVMTALLLRHVPLPRADTRLREGHWDYWAGAPDALRTELGDRSIGLLGFGHIGKAIAVRAKAFGMRVTVCNRSTVAPSPLVDEVFGLDRLEVFMGSADAIVVSLPLLEATRGIVGGAALAAMRPEGVIVNVGRGPVIDEKALYDSLASRRIGGAVIDTWYRYPDAANPVAKPSGLPFDTLPNLLMTPHMSGWTNGTVRRRQATIAENVACLLKGEGLVNVVHRA